MRLNRYRHALSGLHVAVVDDDPDARYILTAALTYYGAMVTSAATSREALGHLSAARPDVAIVDMLLGAGDGLELVTHAPSIKGGVRFIAVSAADFDDRQLGFVGFAAYLRKPLHHEEVVETIRAVVRSPARA